MTIEIPATLGAILILAVVTIGCFYVGGWLCMIISGIVKPDLEIGVLFFGFWGGIISAVVGFYFALDYVLGAVT